MLHIVGGVIGQTDTFSSSGNIGIGTMSPAVKLDIVAGGETGSGKTEQVPSTQALLLKKAEDLMLRLVEMNKK